MIRHVEAVQALARLAVRDVYLMDATGARRFPYVVLGLGYQSTGELPACGDTDALRHEIRVTVAALTGDALIRARQAVQSILSPRLGPARLDVPGRIASVRWVRSEISGVDRDVKDPATDLFAHYSVDTYRIDSDPA